MESETLRPPPPDPEAEAAAAALREWNRAVTYDSSTEAGLNHRWRVIEDETGNETGRYMEFASGLNRYNAQIGQWDQARVNLEVFEGGVLSRQTCFDLILSPSSDDPNGVFDVLFPLMPGQQEQDRRRIRGQCVGVAMTDSTGRSVWISEVSDVVGLVANNEVIYAGCLTGERGFSASLRYSVSLSGVAQDVILHTALPRPSEMGFDLVADPNTGQLVEPPVSIEVWTQLLDFPRATISKEMLPTGEQDSRIDFGGMELARGTAFPLDTESPNRVALLVNSIPVAKDYRQINGMQFLIESTPYQKIAPEAAKLRPLAAVNRLKQDRRRTALASLREQSSRERLLPFSIKQISKTTDPERSALAMKRLEPGRQLAMSGYVIDYDLIAGTVTNQTFKSDTTYYVTGAATLKETTTFEGGTVCKFKDTSASLTIDSAGTLVMLTEPYRPALFISKDDNSAGEPLPDGTNTISGGYGFPALNYLPSTPINLSYINVRDAKHGIWLNNGSTGNVIKHAQFVRCEAGVVGGNSGVTIKIRNALFSDTTNVLIGTSTAFTAEHLTVRGSSYLLLDNGGSSLAATNSIFVNVTNFFAGMTGAYNITNSSAAAVFQEVGAAKHYLQDAFRDKGSSNIDLTLAGELRLKTTYPPLVLSNITYTSAVELFPVVQRDNDAVDPGFHYDPLDWVVHRTYFTNAQLTIRAGTAIGTFGDPTRYGLGFDAGSSLVARGTAQEPIRLARYSTVQEQATTSWASSYPCTHIYAWNNSPQAQLTLSFVKSFAHPTGSGSWNHFSSGFGPTFRISNCEFYSGFLGPVPSTPLFLTNCLFGRVYAQIDATTNGSVQNCTFSGGKIIGSTLATFKNNLFERTSITWPSNTVHSYNAYESGYDRFLPTNSNDVVLSSPMTYTTGTFGRFYQTATNLVDRGSTSATNLGLYHFTSRSSEAKEGNTTVNLGYHYPASDPSSSGLVGYWRLDEGNGSSSAADSSGYGHHGSLSGPSWTSGQIGSGALNFDGVNDSVTATETSALRLPGDMTLALWMKKTSTSPTDWSRVVGKGNTSQRNFGLWQKCCSTNTVLFQQSDASGFYVDVWSSTNTPALSNWFHVAATVQGTTVSLYINGVLDGYNIRSGNAPTSSDPVTFGHAGYLSYFGGLIDDVRIYNRALSAAEIASLATGTVFDTDGDGVPDYLEDVNGNGTVDTGETSGINADSDGDGIPDGLEQGLGTNPLSDEPNQTGQRLNYTYDKVGRLKTVTGKRSETISVDAETNVTQAQ